MKVQSQGTAYLPAKPVYVSIVLTNHYMKWVFRKRGKTYDYENITAVRCRNLPYGAVRALAATRTPNRDRT